LLFLRQDLLDHMRKENLSYNKNNII
jgi:hypothetical protein